MTGIRRVGILGGGLIGLSWSALFLARGCEVNILDPDPQVKVRHARFLQEAWPHLDALGLVTADAPTEVVFGTDTEVLKGAQFI